MPPRDRLLRLALRANASFSTFCGAAAILAAAPLGRALGIGAPFVLPSLGIQLLAFAAFLVWLSTREKVPVGLAIAVIVADLLWVVGSVPLVGADLLTPAGDVVATVVAVVVGGFAALQAAGVQRVRGETRAA